MNIDAIKQDFALGSNFTSNDQPSKDLIITLLDKMSTASRIMIRNINLLKLLSSRRNDIIKRAAINNMFEKISQYKQQFQWLDLTQSHNQITFYKYNNEVIHPCVYTVPQISNAELPTSVQNIFKILLDQKNLSLNFPTIAYNYTSF